MIEEEYTAGHYYQDRKLMPKFTHSSVHYTERLYKAHPHIQVEVATDIV